MQLSVYELHLPNTGERVPFFKLNCDIKKKKKLIRHKNINCQITQDIHNTYFRPVGREFHSLGPLNEKQDCPKDVNFGTTVYIPRWQMLYH